MAALTLFGVGVVATAASETIYWRVGQDAGRVPKGASCVVVVLGISGSNAPLRAIQRWRTRMAVQVAHANRCDRVIFSGTTTRHGAPSEASRMASIGRKMGLEDSTIVLEERSRNTWENVEFSRPLIGSAKYVVIASDALHASRARRYWSTQAGDHGTTIVLADSYSLLDHFWLRLPATAGEIIHRGRNP